MTLLEHVLNIRLLIHRAFDGKMERLGIEAGGYADRHSLSDADRELRRRLLDITDTHYGENGGDFAAARDYTLKQCVFTLFNRLAAIKLMERKQLFPEVIRQRADYGGLSQAHRAWLEEHPEGRSLERDGLLDFFTDRFAAIAESIPLYRADYPYSLMPTADEMNQIIRAFNAIESDDDCAEAWAGDDILGWLYENFNSAEKVEFKNSGDKVEYDKVSLQSQVYTPSWVVKFLVDNSLGKLYFEMFPESTLDAPDRDGNRRLLVANRPTERTRQRKPASELRVIDPACGSGNFLLYAFDLLYDIYEDQNEHFGADYSRREIPALILENNLYGLDLDERAVQMAQIALFIKARERGGRRARTPRHTNVVCTNFNLPTYDEVRVHFDYDGPNQNYYDNLARKLWTEISEAHKFGSLVRIEEQLRVVEQNNEPAEGTLFADSEDDTLFNEGTKLRATLHRLVNTYGQHEGNHYMLSKLNEAMAFLDIISLDYDAVVANPPYTASADFGNELKQFVEDNYRQPLKFNINLYACFIKRCCEFAGKHGKVGMIHPMTFMYIKTFEDVRKFLLKETHISLFVEYGLSNLFGSIAVDPAFYVLEMDKSIKQDTVFISLDQYTRTPQEKFKKQYCLQALADKVAGVDNIHLYHLPQEKLKGIKSWPFIYWISDEFRKNFALETIESQLKNCQGLITSNNNRFLRYWWEIAETEQKFRFWTKYAKGGPFKKWYGNDWLVVDWENNGERIKNFVDENGRQRSRPQNEQFYFTEGVTYCSSGSKGASFRILYDDHIFDSGGSSIFPVNKVNNYYLLGLLNSSLSKYIIDCLNPTVNTQVGDIGRIPVYITSSPKTSLIAILAKANVGIIEAVESYSLVNYNFTGSPISNSFDVDKSLFTHFKKENALISLVLINEAIINRTVFDIYELSDNDRRMVVEKEGESVGDLPVSSEAKLAFQQWLMLGTKFKPSSDVLEHIENLEINDDQPNIADFETLYQNNNDWEEFCIKHKMNPIEVWYQFTTHGVLPPQRSQQLAFELITDVIRTLLAADDDGVIPLTTNAGEVSLAPRIEEELVRRGYSAAQVSQIYTLLGNNSLDRYLQERFFAQLSDRLNLFMYLPKTPFIWHITSGNHHALELMVSIYRWSRDTLIRIKSVYAANRAAALRDRLQVLQGGNATQKAEAAEVRLQLAELEQFCDKVDALLASGYDPKLDDGVGKNIAPLQKAKLIAYDVLNAGQLKKYLNADW